MISAELKDNKAPLRKPKAAWLEFATCFLLVTFIVTWSQSLLHYVPDPDRWDETTVYLQSGLRFAWNHAGVLVADMSPLYSCWYWVLSWFQSDPLKIYYLMGRSLCILIGLSIYYFCRRARYTQSGAFFAAVVGTLLPLTVVASRWPSHFAAVILFLGFGIAIDLHSRRSFLLAAAVTCGMASFARPEMQLSFYLCLILALAFIYKDKRRPNFPEAVALILSAMMAFIWLKPKASGAFAKSFYSFWDYTCRRRQDLLSAGVPRDKIIQTLYGDAHSVTGALINNPSEFLQHCLFYGKSSLQTLSGVIWSYGYLFASKFGLGFLAISIIAICVHTFKKNFGQLEWRTQLTKCAYKRFLFLGFLIFLPTIIASCMFGSLPRYWIVSVLFLMVILFRPMVEIGSRSLLVIGVYICSAMFFIPPNLYQYESARATFGIDGHETYRNGAMSEITYLRHLPFTEQKRILDGSSGVPIYVPNSIWNAYCWNAGTPCPEDPSVAELSLAQFQHQYFDFNILMTDQEFVAAMKRSRPGLLKDQWGKFLSHPETFGFKKLSPPCTPATIFVKIASLPLGFDETDLRNKAQAVGCHEGY